VLKSANQAAPAQLFHFNELDTLPPHAPASGCSEALACCTLDAHLRAGRTARKSGLTGCGRDGDQIHRRFEDHSPIIRRGFTRDSKMIRVGFGLDGAALYRPCTVPKLVFAFCICASLTNPSRQINRSPGRYRTPAHYASTLPDGKTSPPTTRKRRHLPFRQKADCQASLFSPFFYIFRCFYTFFSSGEKALAKITA
jgi:hypothetical protein